MRKLNLLLIALAVLGLVGNANAASLNWEGTNTIRVGDLAEQPLLGGGVATVNNSGGLGHLQNLRLAASRGNIAGTGTAFVTDPEAAANLIASVQFIGVEAGSNEVVINEALSVIDSALARMMQRELVSSGEVADLLLDVRMLLTTESDPA